MYSRSRQSRWCKGETSGNFIKVLNVYSDCDGDSVIYLSDPVGPACHTGARTCWFQETRLEENGDTHIHQHGTHDSDDHVPNTTLYALEKTISSRRKASSMGQGKQLGGRVASHAMGFSGVLLPAVIESASGGAWKGTWAWIFGGPLTAAALHWLLSRQILLCQQYSWHDKSV